MIVAAAGLAAGAALIHGSVMVPHFREYWLFGLFFLVVTPLQLAWGYGVTRSEAPPRRLLAVGAFGSLAIVGLWLFTRTVGLPFGPDPGEVESVGVKDVLASADELLTAMLVALVLWLRAPWAEPPLRWLAWGLVAVSVGAAFIAGH